jgi:hypothetical protein
MQEGEYLSGRADDPTRAQNLLVRLEGPRPESRGDRKKEAMYRRAMESMSMSCKADLVRDRTQRYAADSYAVPVTAPLRANDA